MDKQKISFADDDKDSIRVLALMRMPALLVGLLLGFVLSFMTSVFEELLTTNVQTVFFLPFIVYMADAVGTQSQTIYVRDLGRGKAKFLTYLLKETALGIILGSVFGVISFVVISLWLGSAELAIAVAIAELATIGTAPVVAIIVTEVLELEHKDPALGAGPIATVIQDAISVLVFGAVASALLL